MVEYQYIKDFEAEQLRRLFTSVGWYSGRFPEKLQQAFRNSDKVISAWDGERLVGLIRGMDDGVWQATIDCLLVDSAYQGRGIACALLEMLLQVYAGFLYINVVTEEKKNASFYEKHGFHVMLEGTHLQMKGRSWEE